MRDTIHRFDRVVTDWVLRLPSWLRLTMEFFTLIGQPPFTVGVAAAVLGYGAALGKDHYWIAGWIAIATLIFTSLLKLVLRRVRPRNEYVRHMLFHTYSFPSGHASGALISYGLAAFIIANKWPEFAIAAWCIAGIVSFVVGISRIYLGAHYPSDVVGGWVIGGIGLLVIILV